MVYDKTKNMYRVHSSIDLFHVTGRMNFNDPCLQSVPKNFEIDMNMLKKIKLNEMSENVENHESIILEIYDEGTAFFLDKINENESEISHKNYVSIRSVFIPKDDSVLISADYCQLELRIIANLCKDENLVEAFNNTNIDIFNTLASKWLNLPIGEIDEEKRQNVKKVTILRKFC